ncbi:MAG: regulatory protein RecX [Halothiobacillaceae bacterium]
MAEATARDVAIRLLARREHGRAELARKLRDRGHECEQVDAALDELQARDWLSDQRYAESFLRSRLEKRQGPLKIRSDLRAGGVADEIIEQVLAEQEIDWLELARAQLLRRFGAAPPPDARERARRFRHLQARGFPGDVARQALDPG